MKRYGNFFSVLILGTILLGGSSGCLLGAGHTAGRVEMHGRDAHVSIGFSDWERDLIRDYYHRHYYGEQKKHLPPGLAKKKQLPPGLQQHIVKNGTLPPGLEGRALPDDLTRRLAPLPDNYIRVRLGGNVLLMDRTTRVILDVVYGID